MHDPNRDRRGSGLVVSLSVLAMLAIMATSFITLTRLEVRVTTNYADDLRCELLAKGTLDYFKALLRDDLDRTWGKYENRDTSVGAIGWQWSSTGGAITTIVPGKRTYQYGSPVCNDFWFNPPYKAWTDWGAIFEESIGNQQTFAGATGYSNCVIGRYHFMAGTVPVEANMWIARTLAAWHRNIPGVVVHISHPEAGGEIDFDGDGNPSPAPPYLYDPDTGNYNVSNSAFWNEERSVTNLYYNTAPFILFSGNTYYYPGKALTGEDSTSDLYWRWAAKLGIAHGGYLNLNTVGNLDGADTGYLANMGGLGLRAARSDDEEENYEHKASPPVSAWLAPPDDPVDLRWRSLAGPKLRTDHLGRIRWRGFASDYECQTNSGYPLHYDEVAFHPSQISLEKLMHQGTFPWRYSGTGNQDDVDYPTVGRKVNDMQIDRGKARQVIAYRRGADGRVADGSDRYRVGWRRDGATYYRFPSPERPVDDDRVLGPNEVMEHDHTASHPGTSALAGIFTEGEWHQLKPYVTMWSTDTILRGKIWPSEGPPYTSAQGDWRHFNILKRVNINLIGATGPDGYPGEDAALKTKWATYAASERERLYHMLMAGMRWSNIPATDAQRSHQACQFIASLKDMVDRDHNESYYAAPDLSGAWALGNERHPVINEVQLFITSANSANWVPAWFHIELYNPMENIPWIPDADEVLNIREYRVKINGHVHRLADLNDCDGTDPRNPNPWRSPQITTIGADGLWGKRRSDLNDAPSTPTTVMYQQNDTWKRFVVVGWPNQKPDWLDQNTVKAGLSISLWKPLDDPDAQTYVPLAAGKVEEFDGRKFICVDYTAPLNMIPVLVPGQGPGGTYTTMTSLYRRWDPLNAKLSGTPKFSNSGDSDTVVHNNENTSIIWCRGWGPLFYTTLGRPNTDYPDLATKNPQSTWVTNKTYSPWRFRRHFQRNYKVVDGDLPSIGYLGELIMRNCAQDGPITWVHQDAQAAIDSGVTTSYEGAYTGTGTTRGWKNQLDSRAKFDLFRPFAPVTTWWAEGEWNPHTQYCRTQNLHMLDIFTVWDPTLDGLDNDGDGAVDEEDTGRQPGDKGGPEIRVFGRLDFNLASRYAFETLWPLNPSMETCYIAQQMYGRNTTRSETGYGNWGPFETIGDLLRADPITKRPGCWLAGGGSAWQEGPQPLGEQGMNNFATYWKWNPAAKDPTKWAGDDDGDGVFDERDERDMLFTWLSNFLTTRSNVFEIDLVVDVCEKPFYPSANKLPFPTYKVNRTWTRKTLLGLLDRSTCLRVQPGGRCEFTGPVEVRMLRFTDDRRVR